MAVPVPIAPPRREAAWRAQLAARLAAWTPWAPEPGGHRPAAVALVVADAGLGADLPGVAAPGHWSHDAAVLVTLRAATLKRHAGQWALPGGRCDDGETPEATALRELAEETGWVLGADAVLGRLDTFVSRSGFAIVPVVVWGPDESAGACPFTPEPAEVASVHRLPVAELLRPDAPILEPLPGSPHPVLKMPVGQRWIAAPTAALLYQFREVGVLGRDTRVAHFEQPRFAWR